LSLAPCPLIPGRSPTGRALASVGFMVLLLPRRGKELSSDGLGQHLAYLLAPSCRQLVPELTRRSRHRPHYGRGGGGSQRSDMIHLPAGRSGVPGTSWPGSETPTR